MSYQYPFRTADENLVFDVWQKGREIPKYNKDVWRYDVCDKVMKYSDHGNIGSKHGWEIDHIHPKAHGGNESIKNLRPLNWLNNRDKGDSLNWNCP